jgi:hypothetical protein
MTTERIDNADLRALLADASDSALGDNRVHRLPLEPVKYGLTFREGYTYSAAQGGGYIGYPSDSQPEIIQKKEGPMLLCEDGTVHFLTLWEQMALRAGFTNLQQLNDKHKRQDCQSA